MEGCSTHTQQSLTENKKYPGRIREKSGKRKMPRKRKNARSAFTVMSVSADQAFFVSFYFALCCVTFKSTLAETWRVILVSSADIFLSKSLRIHAERITQKGIVSPPEKVCDTPTYRGGGTSTLSYI